MCAFLGSQIVHITVHITVHVTVLALVWMAHKGEAVMKLSVRVTPVSVSRYLPDNIPRVILTRSRDVT